MFNIRLLIVALILFEMETLIKASNVRNIKQYYSIIITFVSYESWSDNSIPFCTYYVCF